MLGFHGWCMKKKILLYVFTLQNTMNWKSLYVHGLRSTCASRPSHVLHIVAVLHSLLLRKLETDNQQILKNQEASLSCSELDTTSILYVA